ncbi:MAG: hypothetical protein ACYC99_01535 [Candidatus Geothermincolia bacterium]
MGKRKKAVLVALVVVGALGLFMCTGALAVNPTSVTVSATIPSTLQLTMPVTSVTWSGPQTPGATVTGDITASINSNKAYALKVTKDHDLQGATESIPSANLTFGATLPVGGTYNAPAGTTFGTDTRVIEGARGNNRNTTISYSLTVPWDQAPDTYSATHVYTATQP